MFREQLPRPLAHKLNPQGVNQSLQRIFLAGFDFFQQILRGFFRHALQPRNRVFPQRIKIRDVLYQACVHELVHNLVAQPINIHRVPPRKMENGFFSLRRTSRIHAAVGHFSFNVMNRAATFRALFGHAKRLARLPFFRHFQHMRDHFAGALDQHGVANLQAQPLDFIHVVERGTADSDASDLHRLEHGHGRQRSGAAHLHDDVVYNGGLLPRGIFVRNGPTRRFRRVTQFILNGNGVDLDHHAVDFVGQLLALSVPIVAIGRDGFDSSTKFPIVGSAEP